MRGAALDLRGICKGAGVVLALLTLTSTVRAEPAVERPWMGRIFSAHHRSVVSVVREGCSATGFVVAERLVATSANALNCAGTIEVLFEGDHRRGAVPVAWDTDAGVALVRLSADAPVPALELASSGTLHVGVEVALLSHAWGEKDDGVTQVRPSIERRHVQREAPGGFTLSWGRSDLGAAIFDRSGAVVGIYSRVPSGRGRLVAVGIERLRVLVDDGSQSGDLQSLDWHWRSGGLIGLADDALGSIAADVGFGLPWVQVAGLLRIGGSPLYVSPEDEEQLVQRWESGLELTLQLRPTLFRVDGVDYRLVVEAGAATIGGSSTVVTAGIPEKRDVSRLDGVFGVGLTDGWWRTSGRVYGDGSAGFWLGVSGRFPDD